MGPLVLGRQRPIPVRGEDKRVSTLVIAEKPSVARDIARVLGVRGKGRGFLEGNGYRITWALGHLVQFSEPDDYGDPIRRCPMPNIIKRNKALSVSPRKHSVYLRPREESTGHTT